MTKTSFFIKTAQNVTVSKGQPWMTSVVSAHDRGAGYMAWPGVPRGVPKEVPWWGTRIPQGVPYGHIGGYPPTGPPGHPVSSKRFAILDQVMA